MGKAPELQPKLKTYYSPDQFAEMFGINVRTAKRLMAGIPGTIDIGAGRYKILRIPQDALDRFINFRTDHQKWGHKRGLQMFRAVLPAGFGKKPAPEKT